MKKERLETLKKTSKKLKEDLHAILYYFDFIYITSLFLESNKLAVEKIEVKQNIKLAKPINYEDNMHDPKKLIHNFSSHVLTPDQESLLMKGLKCALPPKNLRYENYMAGTV